MRACVAISALAAAAMGACLLCAPIRWSGNVLLKGARAVFVKAHKTAQQQALAIWHICKGQAALRGQPAEAARMVHMGPRSTHRYLLCARSTCKHHNCRIKAPFQTFGYIGILAPLSCMWYIGITASLMRLKSKAEDEHNSH